MLNRLVVSAINTRQKEGVSVDGGLVLTVA
jgi:hypothetical protein